MTEENLQILNDLSREIKSKEEILQIANEYRSHEGAVMTDYNHGRLPIPSELKDVFITLLEDYHMRILEALEIEFAEMFSGSGDKAKMKKRVKELANENAVLRSLVRG